MIYVDFLSFECRNLSKKRSLFAFYFTNINIYEVYIYIIGTMDFKTIGVVNIHFPTNNKELSSKSYS